MKLNKLVTKLVVAATVIGLGASAMAQGGFDWYALTKTVQLYGPTNALTTGSNNTAYIDLSGKFIGSAYVDLCVQTNCGTNTVFVTPQTSPDTTNWTALTNFAISGNVTTAYTNIWYSGTTNGALLATNADVYPFVSTTPNAAIAGWATAYPLPEAYTNGSPVTPVYGSLTRIGVQNSGDMPRYFRLAIQNNGTNVISASFDGKRR